MNNAGKYDDVLRPFFLLMEKELYANTRKGDRPGWLKLDANTLLLEVYWHAAKLSAAVKNNDGPAIMEHSADVANMAMMVLDVCGGIPSPSTAPSSVMVPLSEEVIYRLLEKYGSAKYEATVFVEETDFRAAHYAKEERWANTPIAFARAIEAVHGIVGTPSPGDSGKGDV